MALFVRLLSAIQQDVWRGCAAVLLGAVRGCQSASPSALKSTKRLKDEASRFRYKRPTCRRRDAASRFTWKALYYIGGTTVIDLVRVH